MYPSVISQMKSVTSELSYCTLIAIRALRFRHKETASKRSVFLTPVPTALWKSRVKSIKANFGDNIPPMTIHCRNRIPSALEAFFFCAADYPVQRKNAPVLCVVWVMLPFPS